MHVKLWAKDYILELEVLEGNYQEGIYPNF